ncbi:hypothetical protein [Cohaesibacter gelatinilyticus]|uniref:hypothetical protein n=1 Tax=Cohaesibacter gelatinilyticus TaxID=372072 RepID=UPI000BE36594|nr:hypothetical protein [Cohaesibacter gelatinilyticus]
MSTDTGVAVNAVVAWIRLKHAEKMEKEDKKAAFEGNAALKPDDHDPTVIKHNLMVRLSGVYFY